MRIIASLKSRNLPCGVEIKTPSCTLETSVRYFSSARFLSVMSFRTCTVPSSFPAGSVNVEFEARKYPCSQGSVSSPYPATPSQYQQVRHPAPHQRWRIPPQKMPQPQVAPKNSPLPVVHQNRVADRIERVGPLLLNGRNLFEQSHVLQRQPEQVAYVQQVGDFVRLKLLASRGTDDDESERPLLSRQRHGDAVADAAFRHSLPHSGIRFIFQAKELIVLV